MMAPMPTRAVEKSWVFKADELGGAGGATGCFQGRKCLKSFFLVCCQKEVYLFLFCFCDVRVSTTRPRPTASQRPKRKLNKDS